jgi:hypothetical protein
VELIAQAGDSDISLVDTFRLTYWHTYTADNDALQLSATGRQQVTIGGFSSAGIRVLDITNPDAVREVNGLVQLQGSGFAVTLTVPGTGPRTLLALTPGQAKPVAGMTANEPSHWHQPGLGADLVIIGHRDFIRSIEPLKALRQGQGLQVAVVNVEDLYDEFSEGQKTPYAVQDFLSYAAAQWSPAPRYVLSPAMPVWIQTTWAWRHRFCSPYSSIPSAWRRRLMIGLEIMTGMACQSWRWTLASAYDAGSGPDGSQNPDTGERRWLGSYWCPNNDGFDFEGE